jgi:hypothetical protein
MAMKLRKTRPLVLTTFLAKVTKKQKEEDLGPLK